MGKEVNPNNFRWLMAEKEEARLLGTVKTSPKEKHLEPIIIMALNTGMKKGEILSLKWTNVDFKNGHIIVEGTKNGEIRKNPMNKKLTETLEGAKKVSKKGLTKIWKKKF
jgi:integrase